MKQLLKEKVSVYKYFKFIIGDDKDFDRIKNAMEDCVLAVNAAGTQNAQ